MAHGDRDLPPGLSPPQGLALQAFSPGSLCSVTCWERLEQWGSINATKPSLVGTAVVALGVFCCPMPPRVTCPFSSPSPR